MTRDVLMAELDQQSRVRAVDPAHNIALQASAGTGKTRVLVDRYVRLLTDGVDPSNILAITFTRKAAAEMRERIVSSLRARAAEGSLPAPRWRDLRDRLGDIAISTIDAFCLALLREFPLEADVSPGFRMADDTEVPRLIDEALDRTVRICRGLAKEDEALALLFAQLSERRTRQGMSALLERRLVAPQLLARFLAGGPREMSAADARARLHDAVDAEMGALPGGLPAFLASGPDTVSFALLRRLLERRTPESAPALVARLRDWFLTLEGTVRKRPAALKADFPPGGWEYHKDAVAAQGEAVQRALHAYRRDLNTLMARGASRMYQVALAEYRRTLDAHAVVDFSEVLIRALELLRQMDEFAQSRFRLESRYHHILVDEFQDTSHPQWELVSLLVRSWGEGAGPAHEGPFPPSIFVVGDPKQSIYGFRDADASILDHAGRFLEGLRPGSHVRHAISRSYRSVPALLAFVNDVCGEMVLPGGEGTFRYEESDRFPLGLDGPVAPERSEVLGLVPGASPEECAARLGDEMVRLLREGAVRDRETGVARRVRPGDIAILFRSRTSHQAFEAALEARGIPAYVYKGLGFFDADEIKDVLALLGYLAEPASNLRAAAWLRSRMVGLSDAALRRLAPHLASALSGRRAPETASGLAPEDATRLAQARSGVARWLPLVDRMPPAELLDLVLRESAYAAELRGPRLLQARENLKKMRAVVRRIQNRGYMTLARVTEYIERLSLGDESSAVVDALDAVNLMTVHASKGLEFPVVALVNLARGTGSMPDPIRVSAGRGGDDGASVAIGDFKSEADEAQAARDREETKRLVYVALTRARDRLYLAAVLKDGELKAGRGSLADVLPASLRAGFAGTVAVGAEDPTVVWQAATGHRHRLRICTAVPRGAEDAPLVALVAPGAGRDDFMRLAAGAGPSAVTAPSAAGVPAAAPDPERGRSERALGVLVHRLFERFGLATALPADAAALLLAAVPAEMLPDAPEEQASLVQRAIVAYRALSSQPEVAEAFASGTRYHEVPFVLREGQGVVRGTIDCLIQRPDRSVVVLEFKTGTHRPEHLEQVETYRRAAALLFPGAPVDARLIYARATR